MRKKPKAKSLKPKTGRVSNLFICFFLIFFDQVSKFLILRFFPQIVVFNQGIAFGFLPSSWWLAINLIIVGIVILFCHSGPLRSTQGKLAIESISIVLIISGGISNILDRIIRGAVVDFINIEMLFRLRSFSFEVPIFNLADVFICLGVGILISKLIYKRSKI